MAVVLARLDSTRLPGKALRRVAGRPLVAHVVDACAIDAVDEVVLATTDRDVDAPLASWATSTGTALFRGDATDVARRFRDAIVAFGGDAGLRVNGDSPLHRRALLADGIATWRTTRPDLVSNVPGRTWPAGASVEVVAIDAMDRAVRAMTDDAHREHVTSYLYENADMFDIHVLPPGPPDLRGADIAVDDLDGLDRFAWVASELGDRLPEASIDEIVRLARRHRPVTRP